MKPHAAKSWYEIKAKASDEIAEIYIYDQIGQDWLGEGISAKQFVTDLKGIKSSQINLRINSPGGEVFDGIAISNALIRHPAKISVDIDGIAGSIATVIALAGDTIRMAENGQFFIHNPWGGVIGTAQDMLKMADGLNKARGSLLDTYMHHTSASRREISNMMDEETWFTAAEAQAIGFVHEITPAVRMAACFDLSRYRKVPQALLEQRPRLVAMQPKLADLSTMAARIKANRLSFSRLSSH
jgi:ATP-dependent protease ClpP protease subunit